jgi:MSHA biogenesis protein MshE
MARPEKIRLGELLIKEGLLSETQLQEALTQQKQSGRKLGRVLVESGFVTEEQISVAIAKQLQIPFIDLRQYTLKPDLVQKLPETASRRFRAIVLNEEAGAAWIGMADPTDLFAYDEIGRLLHTDIQLAAVTESQLLAAIDRLYRRTQEITGLAKELTAELAQNEVDFTTMLGMTPGVEDAPVVKLLQSLFEDAIRVRASDIHIEPQETSLRIRFRIDGVLHIQTEADSKIAGAVVLRLKLISGLDISEKRLPQDGRFNIQVGQNPVDIRISTMPTQYGESVVMRLLNQSAGIVSLERVGLPDAGLARLRHALHRPSGMLLVTGPTGSGKTSTLYAALSELNTDDRKIITVEDPVEYRLPGINQVQVHEKIDLTFARVLRTVLRQDPDIVLVGEIRDQTTAEIGLRAAMTGHLVLSTLHTNDALSTPMRLIDMGVPAYMVAMSLQMVVAQRLVRLVCENCARPYTPTPGEHEWLRLELGADTDRQPFRKGSGCDQCNGTGYAGRSGVFELLEMTTPLVEALNRGDLSGFVRQGHAQMQGATLRRAAVALAAAGRTTVAEAMRVASQQED